MARPKVYPRVGGGTVLIHELKPEVDGLSPRGRGNLTLTATEPDESRSIPAWAGEPTAKGCPASLVNPTGLSPRGRGNLLELLQHGRLYRSIPAWAGEPGPVADKLSRLPNRSIPAWAGEPTSPPVAPSQTVMGLSPRGRGNPIQPDNCRAPNRRSIPAWAGEPGPFCSAHCVKVSWVYPRVGGGTTPVAACASYCKTVYPRVGGGTLIHG